MTKLNEGILTKSSNDLQKENITQLYPAFIEESLAQIVNLANASSKVNNNDMDYSESKHYANLTLQEFNQVRNITSIFIRFPALYVNQFTNKNIIDTAQTVLSKALKITKQNGGCCRQFGCDDKATTLLLVWGMERFAHERGESYYTVKAAVEMAMEFQTIVNSEFSISIATGKV